MEDNRNGAEEMAKELEMELERLEKKGAKATQEVERNSGETERGRRRRMRGFFSQIRERTTKAKTTKTKTTKTTIRRDFTTRVKIPGATKRSQKRRAISQTR